MNSYRHLLAQLFFLALSISPLAASMLPYAESFDGTNGGFTVTTPASWQWGIPSSGPGAAHSGSKVWSTNLSGNYSNNESGSLTSPVYDLSAYASLNQSILVRWWQYLVTEPSFDHGKVEVTKDGGGHWETIFGPQSGNVNGAWTQQTVLLDVSYATAGFQIRFSLDSDGVATAPGFYIDDLQLDAVSVSIADSSHPPQDFETNDGGFVKESGNPASSWAYTAWNAASPPESGPPAANSGTHAWGTSVGGGYNASENSTLTSPAYDLSTAMGKVIMVSWSKFIDTELDSDFISLEVSTDDFATFQTFNVNSGRLNSQDWTRAQLFLDGDVYGSAQFKFRYRLNADSLFQYSGVYVDDVAVSVVGNLPSDLQYRFGINKLVGRTSKGATLDGMQVRIGKFATGFTPGVANYDQWDANFVPLTPATGSLVADPDALDVAAAPDSGPWKVDTDRLTVKYQHDPAGFAPGDQLYMWIANSTTAGSTTEAALLTVENNPAWAYTVATVTPQPDITLALSGTGPKLIVGTSFNDSFEDASGYDGIRLMTQKIGGGAPAPFISLEQPAGTNLEAGLASYVDFGNASGINPVTKTFVIKNLGTANLVLGSPTAVTLANATPAGVANFTVLTLPVGTIAPGASTTLKVKFEPSTAGVVNAQVHVASNDPDLPVFSFTVNGTAFLASGTLTMDKTWIQVNEPAPGQSTVVNVRINRLHSSHGTIKVKVATQNGTASAPNDFRGGASQLVTFNDGELFKDVPITIFDMGGDEANEKFTVLLNVTGLGSEAAPLEMPIASTLEIIDSVDAVKPNLPTLATPAVVGVNTGGNTNIFGAATDNKGISKVTVSLNGGTAANATLTRAANGKGASYAIQVTPQTGVNTVVIQSFDTHDNPSPVLTRTFKVTRPLVVNIQGQGTVTKGYAPSSYIEVGKSFTITAAALVKPAPGFVFDGWLVSDVTGTGITAAQQELPALTFTFREGLVLSAKFAANPFTAVAGSYNGLVNPSTLLPAPGVTTARVGTAGFYSATVSTGGAFTGKLLIAGLNLPVSGIFDNSGVARFRVARAKVLVIPLSTAAGATIEVALNLEVSPSRLADKISGTVTQKTAGVVTAVSEVDADRSYYNGLSLATTVPNAYLAVSGPGNSIKNTGLFTGVFAAKDVSSQPAGINTTADFPQGDGFATLKVSKAGLVTYTGVLADGTAITGSATLSHANSWPLFVQMYSLKGCLSTQVTLVDNVTDRDMSITDVLWFRPQMTTQYYSYGWANGVKVDFMAAKFTATGGQSVLRSAYGSALSLADADGNAGLELTGGLLTSDVTKSVNIGVADAVAKIFSTPADTSFTLAVTRASGNFAGSFTPANAIKLPYQGVIYQKGPKAGGYGFFLSPLPKVLTFNGESGSATLMAK